jgi:DNA invertase Pin-like site-specific DNA recombinase
VGITLSNRSVPSGCGFTNQAATSKLLNRSLPGLAVPRAVQRELREAADAKGLEIAFVYRDNGISGAKGRDKRPGLDATLKDAIRGRYGVLMAWSVDRLGRGLPDLLATLQELRGAGVDLYLHRQAVDTRTPAGKALFQMLGVFAEFERAMIQERVKSGVARAKALNVRAVLLYCKSYR